MTATEPSKNTSATGPNAGHVAPELIHVDDDGNAHIAGDQTTYFMSAGLAAWIKQADAELMRCSPTYAAKAFVHDLDRDVIPAWGDPAAEVEWGEMIAYLYPEVMDVSVPPDGWSDDMIGAFCNAVDELLGFGEVGP